MNASNTGGRKLPAVLEDLAASRGMTPTDLAEAARNRGYDVTPAEQVGGRAGFGPSLDAALYLDDAERRRVVAAAADDWKGPRLEPGDVPPLQAPGVALYGGPQGRPNPRTDGGPFCHASYPNPCDEPAIGEVWNIAFCAVHKAEAGAAAVTELWEDAHAEARAALEAARPRWRSNGALLVLLRAAEDEAQARAEAAAATHELAAVAAYGDAPPGLTAPSTLRYNGAPTSGTPVSWWRETRVMALRFMREAHDSGLPDLVERLEPVREEATVQELLAIGRESAERASVPGPEEPRPKGAGFLRGPGPLTVRRGAAEGPRG